jgi:hypothetical protein
MLGWKLPLRLADPDQLGSSERKLLISPASWCTKGRIALAITQQGKRQIHKVLQPKVGQGGLLLSNMWMLCPRDLGASQRCLRATGGREGATMTLGAHSEAEGAGKATTRRCPFDLSSQQRCVVQDILGYPAGGGVVRTCPPGGHLGQVI